MKIGIDIPRIEGSIKRAEFGTVSEALFGLGHERKEISQVAVVKRLGQFSEDEFAEVRDFSDDEARAITPIELADSDGVSGDGFVSGCSRR